MAEIQSNGILINDETVIKLKEYGIKKVYISLDGEQDSHDYRRGNHTYNMAVNAIKLLIKNKIKVSVNFCASKENINDTIKTIELCEHLGVKQFSIIRYNTESRELISSSTTALNPIEWLDYVKDLEEQLSNRIDLNIKISYNKGYFDIDSESIKVRDFSIVGLLFILSDGTVYPCGPSIGNIEPVARFPMDNIDDIISKISLWQCPKRGICLNCEKFGTCKGACKFQPVDSLDFCSKNFRKYNKIDWYPGCPLRGNTLQKDIINSRFPVSCLVTGDYKDYFHRLYKK